MCPQPTLLSCSTQRAIWLFWLPFLTAFLVSCWIGLTKSGRSETPRLVLTNETIQLGRGLSGEIVGGTVELTNNGRALLEISVFDTGCGCSSVQLSKNRIRPGEKALLAITV